MTDKLKTLFILILIFIPAILQSAEDTYYYVRLDYKYINGTEKDKNLLMIPLGRDYRFETYKTLKTTGNTDQMDHSDVHAYAEHSAIENLLHKEGFKSVASKETVINSVSYTETVMSFEGAVKYPYKIVAYGYTDSMRYEVQLEVEFSPVESPDKWKSLYIKDKIKHAFSNIISLFK